MLLEKYRKAYLPKTVFPEFVVDREKCTQCGRCIETCPTMGLEMGTDGFPYLRGFKGIEKACLACRNCEVVCPSGAARLDGNYRVEEGRYRTILRGKNSPPNPFNDPEPPPFESVSKKLTSVERVIFKRRSIRLYKDKPVPREMIHRILEAGRYAPSAGNCTPWKYTVISNRDTIKELERDSMKVLRRARDFYLGGKKWNKAAVTLMSLMKAGNMDQRPLTAIEKADHCQDVIYWNAPVVILLLMDTRGISNPDLDSGICGQNMVLAAHSMGLGTCYIGLTIAALGYLPDWRERLGIEPPWKAITSLGVGYPKGKIDKPVARETLEVNWIE
jgi:nitroreductase/NAD-dependent dihydropyrimidine dehydrogenase PreA subunit